MLTGTSTKTDASAREWLLDDDVMRLRLWASDTIRVLPAPPVNECTLGADESCTIRIDDPAHLVSRLHAALMRSDGTWVLRDLGSKNGVRLDGARRKEIILQPGAEIGIGGITLIAESLRWVALRGFMSRMLGWRSDRIEVVDHALRSIRLAATHRTALVLCGDGDLIPMAHSLHRHAIGRDRPFIVCDPRRRRGKATVRSSENYETGLPALAAAAGGTLCVRSHRLPRDFADVVAAIRKPETRTQLVICAQSSADCQPSLAGPILVPALESRGAELDRIIAEYAEDAITELGIRTPFTAIDREWVRSHSAESLPEIEKGTLRLVAMRASRNVSAAAARLGMAPVSLSRWITRRCVPVALLANQSARGVS